MSDPLPTRSEWEAAGLKVPDELCSPASLSGDGAQTAVRANDGGNPAGTVLLPEPPSQAGAIPQKPLARPILPPEEQKLRDGIEAGIEKGIEGFLQVWLGLKKINEARLYRSTHDTFEDYVRDRWGMTVRRAYQLCTAGEIMQNLLEIGENSPQIRENVNTCSHLPDSEGQIRALGKLPPAERLAAWQEAVDTAPNGRGRVTAKWMEKIVQARLANRNQAAQVSTPVPVPESAPKAKPAPKAAPIAVVEVPAGDRLTETCQTADQAIVVLRKLRDLVGTPTAPELDVNRLLEEAQQIRDTLERRRSRPTATETDRLAEWEVRKKA